jgi:Fe-S cluster assembly protein SufD
MITDTLYTEALARIPGPGWLADGRRLALGRFLARGLPNTRDEDWRYTSLEPLERQDLRLPDAGADTVLAIEDYPGALMAFADNRLIWQDTRLPDRMLGALEDAEAPVRHSLGTLTQDSALAQLNLALWREGVCLRVPAVYRPRLPIFLRFAAVQDGVMLHPRVLVVMEPHADAILVEHFCADGGVPHWQNAVAEIFLKPGARLTHIRLIEGGEGATHTHLVGVRQERDSQYRGLTLGLGGRLARQDIQAMLAEEGAEARLDGLFVADGRRHLDHHLRIDHAASHTTSRATWRGMAGGRGRGIFDGRVLVRHGTLGADARQDSRNLLLSPHAEIDAKPQLEIYSDEVRCGHGATVGSLDEAALFYLASRGIDPATARGMLLLGFANQVMGLADDAGLRDWLQPRLEAALPKQGEVWT